MESPQFEEDTSKARLKAARELLIPVFREETAWPALAAAAFFAVAAMVFAVSAVMAPPSHVTSILVAE